MFSSKHLIKWTANIPRLLSFSSLRHISFGDPRMPDKLYKSIQLEITGCEPAVMRSYEHFIKTAAGLLNVNVDKVVTARKSNKKRFTVLRSAHVHRKHLVQYEIRTHFKWIYLSKLTGSTADTFLEYVERMLPEGVAMKVTKFMLEPRPTHLSLENVKEATSN